MADPKGTYFSPTTPEQGWATVLPERPHKSYASMLAKEMAGRRKLAEAEDKAREAALADLNGAKVGRMFHGVYRQELEQLIENAPKMDGFQLKSEVVKLRGFANATQSVDKVFDENVKWAQQKTVPVKLDEWTKWHNKFYQNPSREIAEQWAQNPPDKTAFLREDGGSKYIDVNKAVKMVVKDNFDGFAKDVSEWSRSKWDKAPIGYVADLRTFQTKVQAFSKYDEGTNSIVMKSGAELYNDGILEPFKQNEFTNRALIDKAKTMIMERTGAESVDDADVTDMDLADALAAELLPYVKGVISERGMTLAIRPSGGGGGGGKVDRPASLELYVRQLSQGAPAALNYAIGGKWGETGDIIFGTSKMGEASERGTAMITTNPIQIRKNYEQQDWFKPLNEEQKRSIVQETASGTAFFQGQKARVLYSIVLKRPYTQAPSTGITEQQPKKFEYQVIVIDPEKADVSTMARLYEAGRGASGLHYEEVVGKQGQRQLGYEYEQAKGWSPTTNTTTPANKSANPMGLIK